MTYEEARRYIEYTDTLGSVPGLDSIKELLKRLGDPQEKVKVVHIAGTNGKGSICAFLDKILEDAGYTVGRYISPTIFTYLERFQINGTYMTEDTFAEYLDRVKTVADAMVADGKNRPTSFETETAIAFCYFADKKVDALLLETGMGGTLDATNVCTKPVCTIIASISMDHVRFLGDTLGEIYDHKLGIMKYGVPCVSYPVQKELLPQWIEKCEEQDVLKSSIMINDEDIVIHYSRPDGSYFSYKGEDYQLTVPGIYQVYNSVVAIETAFVLQNNGYDLKKVNIKNGLLTTMWKGRFQKLLDRPPVYVDGAHNPGGWSALRENIDTYFPGKKLIYVCGVFRDKAYMKMLDIMMPGAVGFIATQPPNSRALDSNELAELAGSYIDSVYVQNNAAVAVRQAIKMAGSIADSVVVIFGSLSFIGPVIEMAERGELEAATCTATGSETGMQRVDNILGNATYRELMDVIRIKEKDRIFCCHGLDHCLDVARIAYIISLEAAESRLDPEQPEQKGYIAREIIYAAALLHDVGRADPEETGLEHHILSVRFAKKILQQSGFGDAEQAMICEAIGSHNTDGAEKNGLAYILYKADKLSRNCFDCAASGQCYWPDQERNKGIIY